MYTYVVGPIGHHDDSHVIIGLSIVGELKVRMLCLIQRNHSKSKILK